ncbi:hypothetical protein [Aurantiacibacter aquimixticola]|uniref:Uncharacterized protein n=1 Tax=Aurantiacibacter aquimixticola TaxID=1958945 RepID=A0A419RWB8_9SPHN|nr:hypothetical protein [Aurantiacibacter aquimixticola]RJY10063.1 hypothetical protein D6201_12485 [Aurantiacibacter aquimixticola]
MRIASLALLASCLAPSAAAQDMPAPGIWTNMEDHYFAEEEGREQADWVSYEIAENGRWREVDAFGEPLGDWRPDSIPGLSRRDEDGWQIGQSELRRARPFQCWISIRKFAGNPDGSEAWTFQRGLSVFDQGGRIFVSGDGEAPDVTLRMRNVTWARGSSNRPSLVLYMHRDDPERAESYSWTSPDAALIGINLRWVQASCAPVGDR